MKNEARATKVAVVGLGVSGLTTLKSFLVEGFDAVGLERNDYIGGLWQWNTDGSQMSVLKSTVANITKQRNSYTDFEFPDGSSYRSSELGWLS